MMWVPREIAVLIGAIIVGLAGVVTVVVNMRARHRAWVKSLGLVVAVAGFLLAALIVANHFIPPIT